MNKTTFLEKWCNETLPGRLELLNDETRGWIKEYNLEGADYLSAIFEGKLNELLVTHPGYYWAAIDNRHSSDKDVAEYLSEDKLSLGEITRANRVLNGRASIIRRIERPPDNCDGWLDQ